MYDSFIADKLGGLYQTCACNENIPGSDCDDCDDNIVNNYVTGDTSCPDGYTAVYLNEKRIPNCHQECFWFLWFKNCKTVCHGLTCEAYWCAADPMLNVTDGLMFGGVYTHTANNPLTGKCDRKSSVECLTKFIKISRWQKLSAKFLQCQHPARLNGVRERRLRIRIEILGPIRRIFQLPSRQSVGRHFSKQPT